jgi:hypothetical protein
MGEWANGWGVGVVREVGTREDGAVGAAGEGGWYWTRDASRAKKDVLVTTKVMESKSKEEKRSSLMKMVGVCLFGGRVS